MVDAAPGHGCGINHPAHDRVEERGLAGEDLRLRAEDGTLDVGLEAVLQDADTRLVARLRDQSGFGMLELLIAMVILNIGVFALVGVFNASTVAIRRAGDMSAATAVADKQMELYRSLQNCAIWLDQWLMPASGSQYALNMRSFNGTSDFAPQIPYWSTVTPAHQQYWVTDGMDNTSSFLLNGAAQANLASCAYTTMTTSQALPLTATNGSAANTLGRWRNAYSHCRTPTPWPSSRQSARRPTPGRSR